MPRHHGQPALIDTLRLARHLHPGQKRNSLTALLDRYNLTSQITTLTPGSQPHRALWDTTGTALLLTTLISELHPAGTLTYSKLHDIAGLPLSSRKPGHDAPQQLTLLDL